MSSAQWANIGDDPGALHALVDRIPGHSPVAVIDYLWLFPARRIAIGESVVVVIGAFAENRDQRRVITAHFTVARNRKGAATVTAHFDEHGSAPVAAVPRIVQGVLRRLGEDTDASPREEQIDGDPARWDALIVELGGAPRVEDPADGVADAESGLPHDAQHIAGVIPGTPIDQQDPSPARRTDTPAAE
ncbi:MAG: hypothetical protein KFH98_07425 [Gemmatimonadetes bacterium]|nr:hypothetical protein [Gemmatimonadota bacterium]